MPSISVVVPVYKVEAFLDRCVSSILRQTFRDFELILVDDGSPDSCGQLCDSWAEKDSRIHVIHQENGGLSAARNAGIDWAFGNSNSSWLCFVDSDDWIHEDYLLRLYKAAAGTGCRISACGFYRTGGESRDTLSSGQYTAMASDAYYCGSHCGGVTMVAWNKLYHKSLFQNLRYPAGKLHEDEFTTYKAVYAAGQVAVIPDELYAYYQNPQGIMRSKWNPRRLHILEAAEAQMDFGRETGREQFRKKALEKYIYTIHEFLEQLQQEPEHRQYRKALRQKMRQGLRQAREVGLFPLEPRYYWAYEDGWPCKVFWWALSKVR